MMRLIFCADPLQTRQPDPAYQAEVVAATKAGFEHSLIRFEALVEQQDAIKAVTPAPAPEMALYRGWMLTPAAYERLYTALAQKNLHLVNTPAAYKHCHYLPESYPVIEEYTPRSTWLRCDQYVGMDEVMQALKPFGDRPVIVKDFVKSRKHEWFNACYIPSAVDRSAVERVVSRFLQLQGEDLNEGLVFREFVAFEPLTTHAKSGMPLTKEFRLFFLDRQLLLSAAYWEEGDYGHDAPPISRFMEVAKQVQSRFFTMDVAKQFNGDWLIVELGDGQVAGLPDHVDKDAFYRALFAACQK